ncbi:hypothetical protein BN1708_017973, partial [Verticillium longisporum]
AVLRRLEDRLRLQDGPLLRPLHHRAHPHRLLVHRLAHRAPQERKGPPARPSRRALHHLQEGRGQAQVPRQEQDPHGDLPGEVL